MENKPDMGQLGRIAASPGGRQLINTLQQRGGQELRRAMEQAARGDYSQAKQAVAALMEDPEVRALLEQLGGMP